MKKLRSLWKDFLKKGFAILTIFMMLGQLGQGAITAFANELAVGDNGALDVTLMYGDKQNHPDGMSYYTGDTMSGYIQITPKNLTTESTYEKLVSLTSIVLQSMTNQRLQKLEMIIKSHFTLTITKSQRS